MSPCSHNWRVGNCSKCRVANAKSETRQVTMPWCLCGEQEGFGARWSPTYLPDSFYRLRWSRRPRTLLEHRGVDEIITQLSLCLSGSILVLQCLCVRVCTRVFVNVSQVRHNIKTTCLISPLQLSEIKQLVQVEMMAADSLSCVRRGLDAIEQDIRLSIIKVIFREITFKSTPLCLDTLLKVFVAVCC